MRIATGTSDDPDGGVSQGALLRRLTRALVIERAELADTRAECLAELGEAATVQAISVIASFDGINRVADATGIELDAASWEDGAETIVAALDFEALRDAREQGA